MGAHHVAISGHINPDGDCLGSVLALASALRICGIRADMLLADDGLPELYAFMPGYRGFRPASAYDGHPDLFVALDTPTPKRLGCSFPVMQRTPVTITIDHHPDMQDYADHSYCDVTAGAVGMMVWDLIELMGVTPTPAIATACFTALITDTGRFQYQNTTVSAFEHAARMQAAGAVPSQISREVYQNRSISCVELEARAIANIHFGDQGRLVYSWVTEQDFVQTGATRDDAESLPDILRSLRGVEVALLMREEGGTIRASMRAKGARDVGAVARALGGGGHAAAAGFTFVGTVDEAIERVVPMLFVGATADADTTAANRFVGATPTQLFAAINSKDTLDVPAPPDTPADPAIPSAPSPAATTPVCPRQVPTTSPASDRNVEQS